MDTDAGSDDSTPSIGDFVVDREDSDPDPAVVVNKPPVPAAEWTVPSRGEEETTVADENPEYDADADVIVVAYHHDLVESHPDWGRSEGALQLANAECSTYSFPPDRLRTLAPDELDGHDSDFWQ